MTPTSAKHQLVPLPSSLALSPGSRQGAAEGAPEGLEAILNPGRNFRFRSKVSTSASGHLACESLRGGWTVWWLSAPRGCCSRFVPWRGRRLWAGRRRDRVHSGFHRRRRSQPRTSVLGRPTLPQRFPLGWERKIHPWPSRATVIQRRESVSGGQRGSPCGPRTCVQGWSPKPGGTGQVCCGSQPQASQEASSVRPGQSLNFRKRKRVQSGFRFRAQLGVVGIQSASVCPVTATALCKSAAPI